MWTPTRFDPFNMVSDGSPWTPGGDGARTPEERMEQLKGRYGPAFLTGNGETGLNSWDSHGYSRMLNDRLEYLRLANQVQNKPAPNVQYGGTMQADVQRTLPEATGRDNSRTFGHSALVSGSMLEGLQKAGEKEGKLDEMNRAIDRSRWSRF